MKIRFLNITLLNFVGGCTISLTALCGCSANHPTQMGDSTDYLPEARMSHHRETVQTHRNQESVQTDLANSRHPTKTAGSDATATASSNTQSKQSRKTEAEIGETSDLKIDDETRQRMNGGAANKTPENTKKPKRAKVESEVRDTSDLQIDEQTKQKMNEVK